MELQAKLETTYVWTCADCGIENKKVDSMCCANCGKQLTSEQYLRHFKLTPTPMKLGWLV